jgi:mono/diheme cytochrome c family protein
MKTRTTVAITLVSAAVLSAAGALIVVETGAYNVAATSPHSKLVESVLFAAEDRSVEVRAGRLTPPEAALKASGREGFQEFDTHLCAMCHGAPGVAATEIGKGLYPSAPELSKAAADMSMAEVYWIVSNGIKDTGMPAFKGSVPEKDLWLIASFVKRLAGMSAKDYQSLSAAGG